MQTWKEWRKVTCGIDEILKNAEQTLEAAMTGLIQELATDFDLDLEVAAVRDTPQARALKGALETFAVWMIHERK